MKKEFESGKGPRYAREKPAECSGCFFWHEKRKRCTLGGLSNCYYLMEAPPRKPDICEGCNIGRIRPCVGYCIRMLSVGSVSGPDRAGDKPKNRDKENKPGKDRQPVNPVAAVEIQTYRKEEIRHEQEKSER